MSGRPPSQDQALQQALLLQQLQAYMQQQQRHQQQQYNAAAFNPAALNPAALAELIARQQWAQGGMPGVVNPYGFAAVPVIQGAPIGGAGLDDQAGPVAGGRRPRSGQGRKRRREEEEAAAAVAAAADEEPEEGEDEGQRSEDEEGAAAGEPPEVDRRAEALDLLKRAGVPEERAARALSETEEQCADFDAAGWADEAQIWLACNAEFEDERDQLAEAMQASLVEAQARKALEAPLEERSPEEIAKAFPTSELLRAARPLCGLPALFQPQLKQAVLRYLQLEKRCCKWWSVSKHFFRQAAAECAAKLAAAPSLQEAAAKAGEARGAAAAAAAGSGEANAARGSRAGSGVSTRRSSRQSSPAVGEQGPVAATGRKSTRRGKQQQQRQQEREEEEGSAPSSSMAAAAGAADAPSAEAGAAAEGAAQLAGAAAEAVAAFVRCRCELVEREVYTMPAGDSSAVPELFLKAAEGAEEEQECIELLDDD